MSDTKQVIMYARATSKDGFWRGGVYWPGSGGFNFVDADKVDAVLNESRLADVRESSEAEMRAAGKNEDPPAKKGVEPEKKTKARPPKRD